MPHQNPETDLCKPYMALDLCWTNGQVQAERAGGKDPRIEVEDYRKNECMLYIHPSGKHRTDLSCESGNFK